MSIISNEDYETFEENVRHDQEMFEFYRQDGSKIKDISLELRTSMWKVYNLERKNDFLQKQVDHLKWEQDKLRKSLNWFFTKDNNVS